MNTNPVWMSRMNPAWNKPQQLGLTIPNIFTTPRKRQVKSEVLAMALDILKGKK